MVKQGIQQTLQIHWHEVNEMGNHILSNSSH